ncbi:hypothetical protein [Sphaerisporangium album]|nr:hypothetical protein [Sphaerisporangium album]
MGGNIWRDPEDDLPADFAENRDVHYEALPKPRDSAEFHRRPAETPRRGV